MFANLLWKPITCVTFPEEFTSAIRALCRSPNLSTLCLQHIRGFPFTTIVGCPNLQCLRIGYGNDLGVDLNFLALFCNNPLYVLVRQLYSKDEISSPQLLYLDSLEIDMDSAGTLCSHIKDISIARHFTRIKNLQVKHYSAEVLTNEWDITLLASQTLEKLDLIVDHTSVYNEEPEYVLDIQVVDLARFPALRHLKIQLQSSLGDIMAFLRFVTTLLSLTSSFNGIEVLEIGITWHGIEDEHGKNLFSSDAGWSTLDQLLTSQTFVSLRKVVLHLGIGLSGWSPQWNRNDPHHQHIMELERKMILPYIHELFPLFRALTRTVESHLRFIF